MAANDTLGLNQVFQIYNEDGSEYEGLVMHKSATDSVVMSLGDSITGDVYWINNELVLTMHEYITYNGVNYVLVNPPTIVREGMVSDNSELKGMTKYSFKFYHPMYQLGNFPFSDVAVTNDQKRYLSENKTFSWIGTANDYLSKLNKNLEGTQWKVEMSSNFPVAKKTEMSEVLSFDKNTIAEALKVAYETWGVPYVVDVVKSGESGYDSPDNKRFKVVWGLPSNEIYESAEKEQLNTPYIFKMGQGVGLKNNSRTPRNNKIITRIAGYGSENNIPYGYPQIRWYGTAGSEFTYGNAAGTYTNVTIGGHTFEKLVSYPIYKGILGGAYVELIKHPFTRTHLMPNVYADALFNKVSPYLENGGVNVNYDPDTELKDYYDATAGGGYPNPINAQSPSYEIHEFEDIKPELGNESITAVTPLNPDLTPASSWDDTMDDDGNYIQSYFQITLPTLSFDIYACAAITESMEINMRSGACLGCTFPVEVDWEDYKANFYNENGEFDPVIHTQEGDGHVRNGKKYPDSSNSSTPVKLILKKENTTFGTLMPNTYQHPLAVDQFVVLGISLPTSYITSAQTRLDNAMRSYMLENNVYYYDYPLKFDEAFLRNNTYILEQLKPNAIVRFEFAGQQLQLFVKQMNVKFGEGVLPKYDITLTDNIDVVLNQIGQVADDVEKLSTLISILRQSYGSNAMVELAKKLSKVDDDTAQGFIRFVKGLQVGERFDSGLLGEGGVFRKDADGTTYIEADKLYIRMRAYFDTVEIRKYLHSGGNRVATIAGAKCVRVDNIALYNGNFVIVDENGTYWEEDINGDKHVVATGLTIVKYRCYFRAKDDDGNEITNDFVIGDQAYCHITNGATNALQMHHYWRLVVARSQTATMTEDGEHWIDLANYFDGSGNPANLSWTNSRGEVVTHKSHQAGSDIPVPQDDIVQLGNADDRTRQGAIIEYVSTEDAPSYKIYQEIDDFDLTGKNYISLGYSSLTGRAYMNVYGDLFIGVKPDVTTGESPTYIKYDSENEELTIKAVVEFQSPDDPTQTTTLDEFASAVTGDIDNLQSQIDGQIETWFYDGAPTLQNLPASQWSTVADKKNHLGDLYYDNLTGYGYRFANTGTEQSPTFEWLRITDVDVVKALADAAKAQDTADHKRRVFLTQPIPPYDAGDLWSDATYPANNTEKDAENNKYYKDLLTCKTAKAEGQSFAISDWGLSTNYTDDTTVANFINTTYAQFVTNIQGQVDAKAETWYQDNDPSNSWNTTEKKESHVGDIWCNTSQNGGKKTYIWQDRGEGASTRFYWAEQAVPDEVFDKIDGKADIFVSKPTTYNRNDLWIIERGIAAADIPSGCQVGDIVIADNMPSGTNSRGSYVKGDWRKKDRYTDDTKIDNLLSNEYVTLLTQGTLSEAIGNAQDTADAANTAAAALGYLSQALESDTQIVGGLVLSSLIGLRDANGTLWSGISGTYMEQETGTGYKGHGIAAWYGGGQVDHEVSPSASGYAKSLFRFDGSGYLAGGNITWDKDGVVTIANVYANIGGTDTSLTGTLQTLTNLSNALPLSVQSSVTYLDPQYSFTNLSVLGKAVATQEWANGRFLTIEAFERLFKALNSSGTKVSHPYSSTVASIKAMFGLWTDQYLSAKGINPQQSGGSGVGDVTWDSLASSSDTRQIALSHLTGALTNYATQSWVNSQGFLKSHQTLYTLSVYGGTTKVLGFKPNANASLYIKAGGDISLTNDTTNHYITLSYSHPTDGANTTISAASGKVLSAITVNNLGHVTSVSSKTLASADIPDLAASKITSGTFDADRIPNLPWSKITTGKPLSWWGQSTIDANGAVSGSMTDVDGITMAGNINMNRGNAIAFKIGTSADANAYVRALRCFSNSEVLSFGYETTAGENGATVGTNGKGYATNIYGKTVSLFSYRTNGITLGLILATNGNVGIGTSSPDDNYTLHINGTVGITGNSKKIYFGDTNHYVELDSDGYFHFSHGLYSDSFVSAKGLNPSGGGGSGVGDVTWELLADGNDDRPIAASHLSSVTNTLILQLNGAQIGTYDGTVGRTINITGVGEFRTVKMVANGDYDNYSKYDYSYAAYNSDSISTIPNIGTYDTLVSFGKGLRTFQILASHYSNNLKYRVLQNNSGTYSLCAWRTIWHSGNFNPSDYLLSSSISDWAKASTKPSYSFSEITGSATASQVPNIESLNNFSTKVYDASVSRTKNYVLAAPSNANGAATFRKLVAADIPNLSWDKITSDKPTTLSGYGITDGVKNDTTWWGRSIINGAVTGDIVVGNGDIFLNKGHDIVSKDGNSNRTLMRLGTDSVLIIGSGAAGAGYTTNIYGNSINLCYGTTYATGITLDSSGKVGIGNTSPSYKLDVTGSIRATGSIYTNSELYVVDSQGTHDMRFAWVTQSNVEYFNMYAYETNYWNLCIGYHTGVISNGALVLDAVAQKWGIGYASPKTKLDVNGGVKASKFYLVKPNAANDDDAVYLVYDSDNSGVRLVGAGFYSDSYVSAKGTGNSGSGGAIDITNVVTDIIPSTGNTYNIGTTGKRWANVYAQNLYATSNVSAYSVSSSNGFTVSGKDNTYVLLAGGGTKALDNFYRTNGYTLLGGSSSSHISLNSVNTVGIYTKYYDADTEYVDDRPTTNKKSFKLIVEETRDTHNNYKRQRYQEYDSLNVYERVRNSATLTNWGDWKLVQTDLSSYSPSSMVSSIKVGTTSYTPTNGVVTLPAYLPLAGGTLTSTIHQVLTVRTSNTGANNWVAIAFRKYINETETAFGGIAMRTETGNSNLFRYIGTGSAFYKVWDEGNDGSGSGLDADLLDGQHGTYYAKASDVTTLQGYFTSGVANQAVCLKTRIMAAGDDYDTLSGYTEGRGSFVAVNFDDLTTSDVTLAGLGLYTTLVSFGYSRRTVQFKGNGWSDTLQYRHVGGSSPYSLTEWKTIAFTDSNITGNAASATILQTSRDLWGRPFDGSADVSGDMTGVGSITASGDIYLNNTMAIYWKNKVDSGTATNYHCLGFNQNNNLLLGYGTAGAGYDTIVYGNNVYLRYGTARNNGVTLTSDGDVGIGTTSPTYKLDIVGQIRCRNNPTDNQQLSFGCYSDSNNPYIRMTDANGSYVDALSISSIGSESSPTYVLKIGQYNRQTRILGTNVRLYTKTSADADTYGLGLVVAYGGRTLLGEATSLLSNNPDFRAVVDGSLYVSTNGKYDGTLSVAGATTLLSTLSVSGHITPSATATYNLGSSTLMYEYGYIRRLNTQSGYDLRLGAGGTQRIQIGAADGTVSISSAVSMASTLTLAGSLILANATYIRSKNKPSSGDATNINLLGLNANNEFLVGYGVGTAGYTTTIYGNSVSLRYSTSLSVGLYLNSSGNVSIGSTTSTFITEKLNVNGNIRTSASDGAFIQIGGARIVWENSSKSLKVIQSDNSTAANFYATGAVSAFGVNTASGSGGNFIPLSGSSSITGSLVPANGSCNLGSSALDNRWNYVYAKNVTTQALSVSLATTFIGSVGIGTASDSSFGLKEAGHVWLCSGQGQVTIGTDNRRSGYKLYVGSDSGSNGSILTGGAVKFGGKVNIQTDFYIEQYNPSSTTIAYKIGTATSNRSVYAQGIWSGTFTAGGSDIRLKNVIGYPQLTVDDIAQAPIFNFTWKDGRDSITHLGTSAQYWLPILPSAIYRIPDNSPCCRRYYRSQGGRPRTAHKALGGGE